MPVDAHGRVALKIPHLYAYTGPGDLCWGSGTDHGVGGMCLVDDTNDQKDGGISVGHGVIGSIAVEPVVRADFVLANHVVHAQVVGFAKYPRWRTLTARWTGPDSDAGDVLIRGWDASGKQILSVNCLGGCAVPAKKPTMAAQTPSASPAPLAQPARPQPSTLSLSGAAVAVLPGVEAWTTKSGICVGAGDFSQCVNDRDHNTDHGFSLGQGVAVTIVGRPVVRAEFTMAGQSFHADVFGFASHPQWRIIAANLNLPGLNGAHVLLKGWDDEGHQILDFDPR